MKIDETRMDIEVSNQCRWSFYFSWTNQNDFITFMISFIMEKIWYIIYFGFLAWNFIGDKKMRKIVTIVIGIYLSSFIWNEIA